MMTTSGSRTVTTPAKARPKARTAFRVYDKPGGNIYIKFQNAVCCEKGLGIEYLNLWFFLQKLLIIVHYIKRSGLSEYEDRLFADQ